MSSENEESTLGSLVKYLPLGGALLIGLGVLKYSIYYDYFGINIMQYLSTTEVLTLFLNDYQSILIIAILFFLHFGFSRGILDKLDDVIDDSEFFIFFTNLKWRIVLILFVVWTTLSLLIYIQVIWLNDGWIYLYIFVFSNLIVFLFMKKGSKSLEFHFEKLFYTFIYLGVLSIIPLMSVKDIRTVDNRDFDKITELELYVGNKIVSNNNKVYLGKAGEYHFYYDYSKKTSKIIKSSDVKTISIKLKEGK